MTTIRNGTVEFDLTGGRPVLSRLEIGGYSIGLVTATIDIRHGNTSHDPHLAPGLVAEDALVGPTTQPLTLKADVAHLRFLAESILAALDDAQPLIDRAAGFRPLGMHGGR